MEDKALIFSTYMKSFELLNENGKRFEIIDSLNEQIEFAKSMLNLNGIDFSNYLIKSFEEINIEETNTLDNNLFLQLIFYKIELISNLNGLIFLNLNQDIK